MAERKAIVLDLDGTLLTRSRSVSQRSLQAIRECVHRGHLVMIGTARPLRTVFQLTPRELQSSYLVLCNGAWIVKDGSVLHRDEIPWTTAVSLAEMLIDNGFQPAIEADDHLYTDPNQGQELGWQFLPLSHYPGTPACKVLAYSRVGFCEDRIAAIIPSHLSHIITDHGTILQISSGTCSKASACGIVFNLEGIDPLNTYAFGDDTNDISLFQSVGMGIAMQNATDELKAVAQAITASNDEDGVAAGISRYILQDHGQMPMTDFYERYYAAVQTSAAHARFCSLVYGKNLCQHGMADMPQVDCLVRMLDLRPSARLLDLGCGDGRITEYIQTATGAAVTGIDLSTVAIEQAIRRTACGAGRLVFRAGDMRGLNYPPDSFDAIVLIDSHYFVEDLEGLLRGLMAMLSVGGRVGLFSDEGCGVPGRDDSQLDARESKIGRFLAVEGLRFEAVNLTKQNRDHWRLKKKVLAQLKDDFSQEGNMFLFENRLNECTCTNRDLDCRFLFLIHKDRRVT